MPIPGNLLTTAMAVMPHKDVDRALSLALSLDVPFWPQLPHVNYREDMYVQAAEHFPGMVVDMENQRLWFSHDRFMEELEEALEHLDDPPWWDITPEYSVVYHRFLEQDLSGRAAIRGQLEGPISFGLAVKDENDIPILFDDTVRPLLFELMAKRINVQLTRLKKVNPNAFMFIDEPGLQFVFSALSGYSDTKAFEDLSTFFEQTDRPRGVHLCGNPDWDFLLRQDMDILSLDVYSNGEVFVNYTKGINKFLDRGGRLVWGLVPTNFEPFDQENTGALENRLLGLWDELAAKGVDRELLLARSMLSPATCCLVNPDGAETVEKAFVMVRELSARLRDKLGLD